MRADIVDAVNVAPEANQHNQSLIHFQRQLTSVRQLAQTGNTNEVRHGTSTFRNKMAIRRGNGE